MEVISEQVWFSLPKIVIIKPFNINSRKNYNQISKSLPSPSIIGEDSVLLRTLEIKVAMLNATLI